MNWRGKNECVEREFAMNFTTGGEYRRSRVPSTRIITASRTRCMYTRFFRVGESPTRGSPIRATPPRRIANELWPRDRTVSIERKLREIYEAHPASKFYVTFTLSNLYLCTFTSLLYVRYLYITVIIVWLKMFHVNIWSHCIIILLLWYLNFKFLAIACDLSYFCILRIYILQLITIFTFSRNLIRLIIQVLNIES